MWRQEIKEQRQDTTLGFYYLCISTPDHIQTATDYFVFCIHTKVISLGSKHNSTCFSQNLSKAQQNRAEPFRAASASAATSLTTGAWGYSDMDKRWAEQMGSPGSSNAPLTPPALQPCWDQRLDSLPLQSIAWALLKATRRELPLLGASPAHPFLWRAGKALGWKLGMRKHHAVDSFLFHWCFTSRKSTLFLLGALKRLVQEVLLATVFELFIPGSSPAISDTHSPIASIGFKYLTLNLYTRGEWQPRSLSHCLPHRAEHCDGEYDIFLSCFFHHWKTQFLVTPPDESILTKHLLPVCPLKYEILMEQQIWWWLKCFGYTAHIQLTATSLLSSEISYRRSQIP